MQIDPMNLIILITMNRTESLYHYCLQEPSANYKYAAYSYLAWLSLADCHYAQVPLLVSLLLKPNNHSKLSNVAYSSTNHFTRQQTREFYIYINYDKKKHYVPTSNLCSQ